ncbi:sensor histidine kinase [Desulfolithobacter sp.]
MKKTPVGVIQAAKRLRHWFFLLFAMLFLGGALWLTAHLTYREGLVRLAEDGNARLELYVSYLRGVLEKYEGLPELLATNKRLVNFLLNPGGHERIEALNRYLETINSISDAADTYLMDREGLTIAASNWQAPRPFVGRNFSYRPYFKEAMQGHLGRYFALGMTSSRRGYYFAYPVRQRDQILGAVVIKINIDRVERNWEHPDSTLLVTDPDGVIFITTNPNWRFHTLKPLDRAARRRIVESRRYPNASLEPLKILETSSSPAGPLIRLKTTDGSGDKTYLLQSRHMEQAGWEVQILSDIYGVQRLVLRALLMAGTLIMLSLLLGIVLWQRRQRLDERHRYERRAREMLEEANEALEDRVRERTRELVEINRRLRREIEERRQAEEELHRTRSELIHAAKLAALGQMSAGINHELNQPLAAIRTYADNTRQLLIKERLDDALWNLEQIGELTQRMARIGAQLKIFARKTSGRIEPVPLHGVVDGALEIVSPALRRSDVRIQIVIEPEDLQVQANNVLLQQVLVNLITNAIQAVEDREKREIRLHCRREQGRVRITVQDSGPGIAPEHLPHIFEAFYTTKEPGQGLGLGLTITARILEEMGGDIMASDGETGARFEIYLSEAQGSVVHG